VSRYLFDTNVLIDIATSDPKWKAWSSEQIRIATQSGKILINPIIYAELAPAFHSQAELDRWLDPSIFQRLPLPYRAGWLASIAFIKYRSHGGTRSQPLPDFFIGAHALVEGLTLVTRDRNRFETYFPEVSLISPN